MKIDQQLWICIKNMRAKLYIRTSFVGPLAQPLGKVGGMRRRKTCNVVLTNSKSGAKCIPQACSAYGRTAHVYVEIKGKEHRFGCLGYRTPRCGATKHSLFYASWSSDHFEALHIKIGLYLAEIYDLEWSEVEKSGHFGRFGVAHCAHGGGMGLIYRL